MQTILLTRRAALIALGAGAAFGLAGCNTTQTAAVQPQAAPSGPRIGAIEVNTAPLLAQSGNPTAQWVQQQLPSLLAQDLAAHMAPAIPAPLLCAFASTPSIWEAAGRRPRHDEGRGDAERLYSARDQAAGDVNLYPSPVDQTLVEQAMQGRVSELSQSFAYWLTKKMAI